MYTSVHTPFLSWDRDCMRSVKRDHAIAQLDSLLLYVAHDCTVYIGDVLDLYKDKGDASLIVLVPVRLGGEALNPIYIPCVQVGGHLTWLGPARRYLPPPSLHAVTIRYGSQRGDHRWKAQTLSLLRRVSRYTDTCTHKHSLLLYMYTCFADT